MPTPRLTRVARVSALYASVRPRIGSPGTSSTFAKKDTAGVVAEGKGRAPHAAKNRVILAAIAARAAFVAAGTVACPPALTGAFRQSRDGAVRYRRRWPSLRRCRAGRPGHRRVRRRPGPKAGPPGARRSG